MTPRIHHFGLLVKNIERFLQRSIWKLEGPIVTDPLQKARLCMVGLSGESSSTSDTTIHAAMPAPLVELIEPLDENAPTWKACAGGQNWHHVCLSFPTMDAGDQYLKEKGLLPVTPWQPAVLFGGRGIRFVYSRNRELVEFLSDEAPAGENGGGMGDANAS
jgi:hypothetical protein